MLQRLEAGIVGQPVIGEDQIEAPGRERRLEGRAAVGERCRAIEAAFGERRQLELGVGRLVLQHQHAQRLPAHRACSAGCSVK